MACHPHPPSLLQCRLPALGSEVPGQHGMAAAVAGSRSVSVLNPRLKSLTFERVCTIYGLCQGGNQGLKTDMHYLMFWLFIAHYTRATKTKQKH